MHIQGRRKGGVCQGRTTPPPLCFFCLFVFLILYISYIQCHIREEISAKMTFLKKSLKNALLRLCIVYK